MALANLAVDELLKRLAEVPTKCLPIVVGICIDKAEQLRQRDQALVARIRALLTANVSARQVARLCRVSLNTVNMVKGVVPPNDPSSATRREGGDKC